MGIIGHGFVGKAVDKIIKPEVKKFIVDPIYDTSIDQLKIFNPSVIIICVPTPMKNDGSQNDSIVENVINEIKINFKDVTVILKSTVLPNSLNLLNNLYPIVYSPEFLRERHAYDDMVNSKLNILAGDTKICEKAKDFFVKYTNMKSKDFIFTDLVTGSLVKYALNTFMATKVLYFNQMNDLYNSLNPSSTWEEFISILSLDDRLGDSHMQVPGPDGRKGYGGACFPKDVKAIISLSKAMKQDFSLLEKVDKTNSKIRKKYKELDKREIDQNVNFD